MAIAITMLPKPFLHMMRCPHTPTSCHAHNPMHRMRLCGVRCTHVCHAAGIQWTSGILYSQQQYDAYQQGLAAKAAKEQARLEALKAREDLPLVWMDVSGQDTTHSSLAHRDVRGWGTSKGGAGQGLGVVRQGDDREESAQPVLCLHMCMHVLRRYHACDAAVLGRAVQSMMRDNPTLKLKKKNLCHICRYLNHLLHTRHPDGGWHACRNSTLSLSIAILASDMFPLCIPHLMLCKGGILPCWALPLPLTLVDRSEKQTDQTRTG